MKSQLRQCRGLSERSSGANPRSSAELRFSSMIAMHSSRVASCSSAPGSSLSVQASLRIMQRKGRSQSGGSACWHMSCSRLTDASGQFCLAATNRARSCPSFARPAAVVAHSAGHHPIECHILWQQGHGGGCGRRHLASAPSVIPHRAAILRCISGLISPQGVQGMPLSWSERRRPVGALPLRARSAVSRCDRAPARV